MRLFGLLGYPVSHSFSEKYFSDKFMKENVTDAEYRLFALANIDEFPDFLLEHPDLCGLNVTIPHKENIIKFMHELDDTAAGCRAVNVVKVVRKSGNVYLKGYNTDIFGFGSVLPENCNSDHQKALILGTGGASKAVAYELKSRNIDYLHVSRNRRGENYINYSDLSEDMVREHTLIVNTTPLGMHPNIEGFPPIAYHAVTPGHILYDIVYNPSETMFLKKGKEQGANVINGLQMLHNQADKAWGIWNSGS